MYCIDILLLCEAYNSLDVEVGFDWPLTLANQIGFVGFEAMQREAVFVRINCNRAQAELIRGAKDSNRDFASVCSEELLDFANLGHAGGNTPGRLADHCSMPAPRHYSSFFNGSK